MNIRNEREHTTSNPEDIQRITKKCPDNFTNEFETLCKQISFPPNIGQLI
jgi:hypothetical protein